jgi:hypothetical protein
MIHHLYQIWYKPREVIREAFESASPTRVRILAACFGIIGFFDNANKNNLGETLSLHWILLLATVAGSVSGILALYFFSFLLRWTGRLVKGQASPGRMKTALAYSTIPTLWFAPVYAVMIGLKGREAFVSNQTGGFGSYPFLTGLVVGLFPIWLMLGIWIVSIGLRCLSEAQGFSVWRAIINAMLAFTVLVFAVVVVTMTVVASISIFS